jgi:hypothetical protein
MSNLAGKANAMTLITPINGPIMAFINKTIFYFLGTRWFKDRLKGLLTLSMIHYARWVIVSGRDFPRLSESQPVEDLGYSYMFFFSNFNGSWAQYVDSFSAAIPDGLDGLWWHNVGWPKSVPEEPFHRYVTDNQLWTSHYYSAYPMAASNDVKSAKRVKDELRKFARDSERDNPNMFVARYHRLLKSLHHDLGQMAPTPIVSLATQAVDERRRADAGTNA